MIHYGRDLTRKAVDCLVAHPGGIGDRLAAAFDEMHPVLARTWDAPFELAVSNVAKGFGVALDRGAGSVRRGCRRMHYSKTRKLAVAIVDLFAVFSSALQAQRRSSAS
jgi:hypothetical protein